MIVRHPNCSRWHSAARCSSLLAASSFGFPTVSCPSPHGRNGWKAEVSYQRGFPFRLGHRTSESGKRISALAPQALLRLAVCPPSPLHRLLGPSPGCPAGSVGNRRRKVRSSPDRTIWRAWRRKMSSASSRFHSQASEALMHSPTYPRVGELRPECAADLVDLRPFVQIFDYVCNGCEADVTRVARLSRPALCSHRRAELSAE